MTLMAVSSRSLDAGIERTIPKLQLLNKQTKTADQVYETLTGCFNSWAVTLQLYKSLFLFKLFDQIMLDDEIGFDELLAGGTYACLACAHIS